MKRIMVIGVLFICGVILILIIINLVKMSSYENKIRRMKLQESFFVNIKTSVKHNELKQNGYSIHYYTCGDTANELLIFLHPAFADHRCFDKQIDFFSKKYRIVTIDMLGHGLSKVNNAKDKIDFTVYHIDTILKTEGYNKAHFIGASMGTLIAQYYALKYPENILSMTILGGYDISVENKEITKTQRSENFKWLIKAIFSMNSFRRYVANAVVNNAEDQARFYCMTGLFTRKSFTVMPGLKNILKLRKNSYVHYPLLLLCGENDLELVKDVCKKWNKRVSKSKYYIIKNAGHCANMDNPEVFNKIVMNFIENVE